MSNESIKQQAHELIDELPDTATWEEIAYRIEVHASIVRGLADSEAGRLISQEDIKKHFGIKE